MPRPAQPHLGRHARWLALLLAAGLPALAQAAVFVCHDGRGGTVTTDHLDSDCLQYGGKELNADGSLRRQILTRQQQEQQQAAMDRSEAASEQALQRQREERALLARYPDDAALRKSEADDLKSVQALIDAADARLRVLGREHLHLEQDAQFYPNGNYPNDLRSRMQMNQDESVQEHQLITAQQREMQRIRNRYASLRARLQVLWARQHALDAAPSR